MPANGFKRKGMEGTTEGTQESVADGILADGTTTPTSRTTKGDSNRDNSTSLAQLGNDVSRVLRKLNRCETASKALSKLARERTEHEKRFSVQEWAEWVRSHDVTDAFGRPFTVSNSDTAIVARLLVERVPSCRPFLELRASKYDALFRELGEVSEHEGA